MSDALADAVSSNDLGQVIDIYTNAASEKMRAGDVDSASFLLTQGWIFALDADDPRATEIHAQLVALGRETEE
ncbi:MAG: hypothetical protein AAF222_11990 [Pseudomonadota bacterium]